MASESSIKIFQRTLLKLLIRRGTDLERQGIILSEGELGFTTDTQKLYAGDGSTPGGIQVTGSKFLGYTGDITSLAPADINDVAFSTSDNTLYFIASNNGATLSDWTKVGAVCTNTDGTIIINAQNVVSIGDVSGESIRQDNDNKITLKNTIYVDTITKKTSPDTRFLGMPSRVSFGSIDYKFPESGSSNSYLRLNSNGVLTWSGLTSTTNTFVNSEVMPVGTIVPYADIVLPSNGRFLRCDGAYVLNTEYPILSSVIAGTFGPLSTVGLLTYVKLPDLRGAIPVGYTNTAVYDLSGNSATFAMGLSGGLYQAAYGTLTSGNTITTTPHVVTNYIIKAIADPAASCSLTITDSLSASLNGTPVSTINPLSGDYLIGLSTLLSAADLGYVQFNSKGQVINYDVSLAGSVGIVEPSTVNCEHDFGFINFLRQQESIVSDGIFGVVPSTWSKTMIVYPRIYDVADTDKSSNIPRNAKNVIITIRITSGSSSSSCLFTAASDISRLGSGTTIEPTEFALYKDAATSDQTVGQFIIPLYNDGDTMSFAMRGHDAEFAGFSARIVGWTL